MNRIKFQDTINGFQIRISSGNRAIVSKILNGIIFMCFWLIPDFIMIRQMLNGDTGNTLVGLIGWNSFFLLVFQYVLWQFTGVEIITVDKGQLIIEKKGLLFSKPRIYPLSETFNFLKADSVDDRGRISNCIQFDFQNKTIKFGKQLNEEEANEILQKLRDKRIIPKITQLKTDIIVDEIEDAEATIFSKTKTETDVPIGRIRLSQADDFSKVFVTVIGSIAFIWFLWNCINLEIGLFNILILAVCTIFFITLKKTCLIEFDRNNIYLLNDNKEEIISLDRLIGMKILLVSSNKNRFWKIFYKDDDGKEKSININPVKENQAKFRALLTELNPKFETDYSSDFSDTFFPPKLKSQKQSEPDKNKRRIFSIALKILFIAISLYIFYMIVLKKYI
jgi:hypothetical protein